jgi:hypothetical protein
MLNLEDFMNIRDLKQRELSVSLRSHDWEVKTQVGRGGYSTPACR